MVEIKEKNW